MNKNLQRRAHALLPGLLAIGAACMVCAAHAAPPTALGADDGRAAASAANAAETALPADTWVRDTGGTQVDVAVYTPSRLVRRADFVAVPGSKRLHIALKQRMSSEQVGRMLIRDVDQASSRTLVMPHAASLAKLGQALGARSLQPANGSVSLDYVPDLGTRVLIDNTPASDFIGDAAFFALLVRPWLAGNAPRTAALAAPR